MKYWIHTFLIFYSLLTLCQLQPFLNERDQLVNQWVEFKQGEVMGVIEDEHGKPMIAQLRFFDPDGAIVKEVLKLY